MLSRLRQRWLEARALAVLQEYYELPLHKPLPSFEQKLLRGAVKLSLDDGGTPFDAAMRFYAAYAETALRTKCNLAEINFSAVTGRMFSTRDKMKHYDEHHRSLMSVSEAAKQQHR